MGRGPHSPDLSCKIQGAATGTEMTFYLVWLEDEEGRRHLFDLEPIPTETALETTVWIF